ncbi:protein PET117 homolog, mitochondrial [Lethenteron reissneri]|uniref:protein PET117 homolog, mitochondrial n=1 Tax=Lethenteron reissneri TaxID=7753 RepID=UPI002AB70B58|nr:protein PET117 homolog, mitochondrial [Lethenteron reissneri]XP_061415422.1 protein PET117 homolog, mitochondrial [Lethenteron reissneri]XP_061415423.1 protein PET117 homolog, mitochondrial [Lethenteron reissneri]
MSTISKVTLGLAVVFTVSTVAGVHLKQQYDRQRLREGVYRDIERQERKAENLRRLQEQAELSRILEAERQLQLAEQDGDTSKH